MMECIIVDSDSGNSTLVSFPPHKDTNIDVEDQRTIMERLNCFAVSKKDQDGANNDPIYLSDDDEISFQNVKEKLVPLDIETLPNLMETDRLSISSDDTHFPLPLSQRIYHNKQTFTNIIDKSKKKDLHEISESDENSEEQVFALKKKKICKSKTNSPKKSGSRLMNEDVTNDVKRKEKLIEKEQLNHLRNLEKEIRKRETPAEALKHLKTIIDKSLMELPRSDQFLLPLQESNIGYSLEEQIFRNAITWNREVLEEPQSDFQSELTKRTILEEDQVVVLLNRDQFIRYVEPEIKKLQQVNHPGDVDDTLSEYVSRLKNIFKNRKLTLAIIGTESYFKNKKNKKNREYRNALRNEEETSNANKRRRNKNSPTIITEIEMEEVLIMVQLKENINIRLIESETAFGQLLVSFATSIAQTPYKRRKYENDGFSWLLLSDNVNTIKVDKIGEGLLKVWQQQLMQFHQVSKDTAQAIVSKYPSPQSLIKAYKECLSLKSAESLLQDIQVRRGIGPLETSRKVGPELSSKIYILLTTKNGETLLQR